MPTEVVVSNDGVQPTSPGLDLWVDLTTPASMQSPSIPTFASTAARDSAWPTPYPGAMCVTTDTGSMWQYFASFGGWTAGWFKPFSVLGVAEVTAVQGSITSIVDVTGMSLTITVPPGRRIKFTGQGHLLSSVAGDLGRVDITSSDGSITYQTCQIPLGTSNQAFSFTKTQTPAGGTFTYKLRASRALGTGTLTFSASAVTVAQFMCEDVGAA